MLCWARNGHGTSKLSLEAQCTPVYLVNSLELLLIRVDYFGGVSLCPNRGWHGGFIRVFFSVCGAKDQTHDLVHGRGVLSH